MKQDVYELSIAGSLLVVKDYRKNTSLSIPFSLIVTVTPGLEIIIPRVIILLRSSATVVFLSVAISCTWLNKLSERFKLYLFILSFIFSPVVLDYLV